MDHARQLRLRRESLTDISPSELAGVAGNDDTTGVTTIVLVSLLHGQCTNTCTCPGWTERSCVC